VGLEGVVIIVETEDLFGIEIARKNLSRQDPQLQYALTLFPEAEALMRLGSTSTRAQR